MTLFGLTGQVALVTGSSSGLGVHLAEVLARAGARVILAARRSDQLDRQAERLRGSGADCSTLVLDVSDRLSIEAASDAIQGVDILVNNAGIVREDAALEQSEADWDAVLDANLKGTFLMSQAVARAMRARGSGGSIINVASILGLRQGGNVLPYAVSKAGVVQFTKTLALEVARHGIRVNALAPGYFATELNAEFWEGPAGSSMIRRIPQRRLGRLEDLDGPLLLLASDASRYMTGAVIAVDGGHLVSTL